ncbi:hypothetical protein QTP88_012008 [Uroleucon formosanum]
MTKTKKSKKILNKQFAVMKKTIKPTDTRIKEEKRTIIKKKIKENKTVTVRQVAQTSSALFFQFNTQLGPPYHILVDTNFISFSIKYKMDVVQNMMDCLYAKCIPYVTDCIVGELEKLGQKYKIALKIVKDPRFQRIQCMHPGTYADDCLVQRVTQHKCYIVATCDRDLKRRIRKIPGVPLMYIAQRRYTIERMPDAYVKKGDVNSLKDLIVNVLFKQYKLNPEYLVGQAYDGAAVKSSVHGGLQKKINDYLKGNCNNERAYAPYIDCPSHRINLVLQNAAEEKSSANVKFFFACLQNIYDYFAYSHRRWYLLLEKSKSAESFTSLVNEDQNLYERELEDTNISLHADSESEIENIIILMSRKMKIHQKDKGSARVKVTEALLSNFQSVVECLEEESESLFQARYIFTDVLEPAEFPKRTKKMPLQIDENTTGISLSEEDKHRTIYFETLDNMMGELNERMNGFSKVLKLFYFLNPDELKKLNIDDVKRNLAANLVFIKSNFGFISDVMNSLEAKHMPLSDAAKIIEDVFLKLNQVPGTVGKMVQEKMNDVLEKNEVYQT